VLIEMTTKSHKLLGNIISAFLILGACVATAETQEEGLSARETKAGRARELIKETRLALGGEEALSSVRTLSVSGKVRRFVKYISVQSPKKVEDKEKVLSGKVEVDILLPDRFRKHVSGETLRGFGYSYAEVVNGDRAWRNPPLRTRSSHRDSRVIDVDDFERTIQLQALSARQQLTIYSLALMMQTLPSFPLDFNYEGRYRTMGGEANLITARGPDDFQLYLLLDPKTKLPISLAWTFQAYRQPQVLVESPVFFDRKVMIETYQRARQERQDRSGPAQRYEFYMKFSDYRQIAGVLWPHRITGVLNNEIIEEFTLKDYEINRPINPKKFEGQPEPKY
jgi:hypothetical protein